VPRLFIAVWPPAAVVERLQAVARADEPGARWIAPRNWHVTLRFLGDADPEQVSERLIAAPLPAAMAALGPEVSKLGRGNVVVPVSGLEELAARVFTATADLGQRHDRPFTGHLTLARLRGTNSSAALGVAIEDEFAVNEIVLVDSETPSDGAHYRNVGRWPLS
jgi:2'-5' RNA ligase